MKKGEKMSNIQKRKISKAHKGRKFTKEHRVKLSLAKIGRPSPKKGKPGVKWTKKRKRKFGNFLKDLPRTPEWRRKIGESHKGEKCTFWKGGISTQNELARKSIEYQLWREAVFKRDNWTCVMCFQVGGRLNADHIKPFSLFPELRFILDNGRTLCEECHKKTDTFGWNLTHTYKKEKL